MVQGGVKRNFGNTLCTGEEEGGRKKDQLPCSSALKVKVVVSRPKQIKAPSYGGKMMDACLLAKVLYP